MAKTQLRISRAEQLERPCETNKGWNLKNRQFIKAKKIVDGRALNYMTIAEVDQGEEVKKYKPEDFMLENLIEIGAVDNMQQEMMLQSTLNTIDHLEEGAGIELHRMDAEEWANKYLNSKKNNKEE